MGLYALGENKQALSGRSGAVRACEHNKRVINEQCDIATTPITGTILYLGATQIVTCTRADGSAGHCSPRIKWNIVSWRTLPLVAPPVGRDRYYCQHTLLVEEFQ